MVPLFCGLPFHEYTVNAVNALLTLHALVLHSSCHREYGEVSALLGWLMLSPKSHNMHHNFGEKNACNFSGIFKLYDRIGGTLNEGEPFWWKTDREAIITPITQGAKGCTSVATTMAATMATTGTASAEDSVGAGSSVAERAQKEEESVIKVRHMTMTQVRGLATRLGLKYDAGDTKEALVSKVTEELARDIKAKLN